MVSVDSFGLHNFPHISIFFIKYLLFYIYFGVAAGQEGSTISIPLMNVSFEHSKMRFLIELENTKNLDKN